MVKKVSFEVCEVNDDEGNVFPLVKVGEDEQEDIWIDGTLTTDRRYVELVLKILERSYELGRQQAIEEMKLKLRQMGDKNEHLYDFFAG